MSFPDNFDPAHFLSISKDIHTAVNNSVDVSIQNTQTGAWMRSAISRAYYSAYLILREAILKSKYKYIISNNTDDHASIKELLKNLPPMLFHFYNDFEYLRKYRNHSDYDLPRTKSIKLNDVEKSNILSQKIASDIKTIMKNL